MCSLHLSTRRLYLIVGARFLIVILRAVTNKELKVSSLSSYLSTTDFFFVIVSQNGWLSEHLFLTPTQNFMINNKQSAPQFSEKLNLNTTELRNHKDVVCISVYFNNNNLKTKSSFYFFI